MKELKLKDIPIKTMDGKPLTVGQTVYTCDVHTPYHKPTTLDVRKFTVEYINGSSRTYMVKDHVKGFEHKFSNRCHFYSSEAAALKSCKSEIKELISEKSKKIKYLERDLKFLKSLKV